MASRRGFLVTAALLFAASAAVTIAWCRSMSAMAGMPMPGGWILSMAWMPMCGQSWAGTAATFLGMWSAMMAAMMLPSLIPMLARYRTAIGRSGAARLDLLTALAGAGYFTVWVLLGAAIFGLSGMMAAVLMERPELARAAPFAAGAVVLIAGALQFTAWKARHLACCRQAPERTLPTDAGAAWRHGFSLGLHCIQSCAGPTASLLVLGVMDLWVMAAVTAAITLERLAPHRERAARANGMVAIAAGLLLMGQAVAAG